MIVACASEGQTHDSPVSQVFGRARNYIFADTDTSEVEVIANPALNEGGGAGIKAAEFVVNRGADAVIAGNFGPNAFQVLKSAGIPCYAAADISIPDALKAINSGELIALNSASARAHAGMKTGSISEKKNQQDSRDTVRKDELATLKNELADLRERLSTTLSRIEKLEKENP